MVLPINIVEHSTKEIYFRCEHCDLHGTLHYENMDIYLDREGLELAKISLSCMRCGKIIE